MVLRELKAYSVEWRNEATEWPAVSAGLSYAAGLHSADADIGELMWQLRKDALRARRAAKKART